jgi:thiosulfate reductase cytochrome b subunit
MMAAQFGGRVDEAMTKVLTTPAAQAPLPGHARSVRITHWIASASLLALTFTGVVILMAHPRLYWGEAGNDLTPALFELPISRNHQHGGWTPPTPFFQNAAGPVSASRTFDIFNQNGWGRSLHFLSAWFLVGAGIVYLLAGFFNGHFRSNIWPRAAEVSPRVLWTDIGNHLRLRIPPATGGPHYGALQKCAYGVVVFLLLPLIVTTGMAMSPAITASVPALSGMFGGFQSARTVHFFAFVALVLFVLVHVAMVVKSGFRRQIRAMTIGRD